MSKAPTISGGAQVTEVEVQPLVPAVEEGDATVNVITTAPGTLGPGGIVRPGTKVTVPIKAFSANWMKPATAADAKKLAP